MDITAFFASLDPSQVGLGALVTFGIFSILRGWIVPISVHKDRIGDKDKQILAISAESNDWKAAYMVSEEALREVQKQNSALIDGAETTNRLMESLRNQIESRSTSSPPKQIEG